MSKTILVSCLAASFLLSGAAMAPSWATATDTVKSGKLLFAEGDENEQAPQEEQEGGDRDGHLINTQPTFNLAQSEEGAGSEQQEQQEQQEEQGGGSD